MRFVWALLSVCVASVHATDVALMVVTASGTSTASYSAAVQAAFAGLGMTITTMTASSTATGFVIEVPAQAGKTAAELKASMETCEFRSVLQSAWSGPPWSLEDVSVDSVCLAESGALSCGAGASSTCGSTGGGGGGGGDALSLGAILGIVFGSLAAVALVVVLVLYFFTPVFGNTPSLAFPGTAAVPQAHVAIPAMHIRLA